MNTFNFKSTRIAKMCKALFVMLTCSQATAFAQACDASSHLMQTTTVTECTGYLYDNGGGAGNYSNSKDYTFTINPSDVTDILVTFSQFATESGYDYVSVKDAATNYAFLNQHSGSTNPGVINCGGLTAGIKVIFHSDTYVNGAGFARLWTSSGGSCGPIHNMPNLSAITARGMLYDSGGRTGNYSHNEDKLINIYPTDATYVCLHFSQFSLGTGDYLYIYDDINGGGSVLYTFSSSSPASTSINYDDLPGDGLSIRFTSNSTSLGAGFAAIWSSDGAYPFGYEPEARTIGDDQGIPAENKVSIFPNPTDSKMAIAFQVKEETQTKVVIYNIAGMETVVLDKTLQAGMQKIDFDATSLAPGMYFCKVVMGTTVLMEKVIKN